MVINKHILIEDLIELLPESADYLSKKGIQCIQCGEPIWGSLEETAKEKGFTDVQIDTFVRELKALV